MGCKLGEHSFPRGPGAKLAQIGIEIDIRRLKRKEADARGLASLPELFFREAARAVVVAQMVKAGKLSAESCMAASRAAPSPAAMGKVGKSVRSDSTVSSPSPAARTPSGSAKADGVA